MDTTTFKKILQAEEEKLQTDLRAIATYDAVTGNWEALPDTSELGETDENNEADGVETWNERRATVSQLEIRYKNIVRALNKIATGTYGICEISGEVIETQRLEANPAARTCIAHRDQERELSL